MNLEEKKCEESMLQKEKAKKVPRTQKPDIKTIENMHQVYGVKTENISREAIYGREGARTSLEVQ